MDDKISILYVDDEEDNLTTFKSVFRREYDITLANSGQEALDILADKSVDLIITDQRMPEMSGIDLLIKIVDLYPKVLRIILTGYSDVNDVIMAINSGKIHSYITKPWNKEDLKNSIEKVLAKNGK
ncbi:MAG: response regulator [bacterium]|nr:response regulator [bacterium]